MNLGFGSRSRQFLAVSRFCEGPRTHETQPLLQESLQYASDVLRMDHSFMKQVAGCFCGPIGNDYTCSRLLLSICKFSEDSVLFALRHKAVEVNGMALQYAVRSPKCQWPHVPYRRFKEGVYNQRLIVGRKGWRDERICHLCSAWTDRLLVWGTQAVCLGGMGCLLMSPSMLPSKAEEVVDRDLVLEAQTKHKYCAKRVWIWIGW